MTEEVRRAAIATANEELRKYAVIPLYRNDYRILTVHMYNPWVTEETIRCFRQSKDYKRRPWNMDREKTVPYKVGGGLDKRGRVSTSARCVFYQGGQGLPGVLGAAAVM